MIVDLSLGAPASLVEPQHFRAFMVRASCSADRLPDLARGHADVLAALDQTHAWVRLDWLRAQSPDAHWRAALEAMLDAARAHGWVRADASAVRGHMQWSGL